MLTLNDGRAELWQWDTGRTLAVDVDCSQVHFSNKVFGRSIDVDVTDGAAIIPDILLQTDKDLNVWAFVGTAENGYTKISKTFKVNRRNKPADYVFTPVEQTTIAEIAAIAQSVRDDADAGLFDGSPGPKGPQGEPGPQGPKGDPGADGHTPEYGVDYGTPEQIAGIARSATDILQPEVDQINDDIDAIKTEVIGTNKNNPNQYESGYYLYQDGAVTKASSATYYRVSEKIPVSEGDVVRGVADSDINYKCFITYNGDTAVDVSSSSTATRTYITIDNVGKYYYSLTVPNGIDYIRYQYERPLFGAADMLTINEAMPETYTPYVATPSLKNNVIIPTTSQITNFTEDVEKITSGLNGKKVGFLGDSYTDVSYYYGAKIAEQTGMIAVAKGKQGSRIFSDNSWTSGGQTVTALSFWHRVNLFTDNDFDAICIFGGINDASARSIYETNLGSITDAALTTEQVNNGAVPTTFYQAYKTVVEMLWEKYPNLPLLIIIPPHQLNASYNPPLKSYMGIEAIRNAELSIAEFYGIPVCDLYKNCQELNNYSANVSAYRLGSDDVHPNNAGQTAMAKCVRQALTELLV